MPTIHGFIVTNKYIFFKYILFENMLKILVWIANLYSMALET